jgi:DNA-binding NtrC family response regulator
LQSDVAEVEVKPRILVFDSDQAITQQLFWTLCEKYDVVTANDLHTALRRVSSYQPVVAVVELSASSDSEIADTGLRIVDYMKTHLPKSKILGMTAEDLTKTKKKFFLRGIDEMLDKPFDTEQFLDILRQLAPLRSFDSAESGSFKLCY